MQSAREIENLIYRYAELIDEGDLDGTGALFEHAEVVGPNDELRGKGAAAMQAMYHSFVRLYGDGTPKTHHVTTNVMIEVDEEAGSATARSYFTVFQATPELPLQAIIAGRYHDQFQRIDGRWHFSRRKMMPRLYGDMSQHQLT